MDGAEPVDTAPVVMDVERLVRDDGRLLLLFTWPGETTAGDDPPSGGPA